MKMANLPPWVPVDVIPYVASALQNKPVPLPIESRKLLIRLLTDERMEKAWSSLERASEKAKPGALERFISSAISAPCTWEYLSRDRQFTSKQEFAEHLRDMEKATLALIKALRRLKFEGLFHPYFLMRRAYLFSDQPDAPPYPIDSNGLAYEPPFDESQVPPGHELGLSEDGGLSLPTMIELLQTLRAKAKSLRSRVPSSGEEYGHDKEPSLWELENLAIPTKRNARNAGCIFCIRYLAIAVYQNFRKPLHKVIADTVTVICSLECPLPESTVRSNTQDIRDFFARKSK